MLLVQCFELPLDRYKVTCSLDSNAVNMYTCVLREARQG